MTAGPPPIIDADPEPAAARALRAAAELLLLALVAFAPWPFASAPTVWEFVLRVGLAVLVALWAAHAVVTRRFAYAAGAVSTCLLGLVLLTAVQLVPLPEPVVAVLSPQAAEWHRTLRPERPELLPGESEADVPGRPNRLPLSIDPTVTQNFLSQLLAVFLAYAVARNLIASKDSFRRLAWVGFGNGVLLAAVAIGQSLSGSREMIFWSYHFDNQVFGPFVNKNHYADYVALCVGLGLGLLVRAARRAEGEYAEARSFVDRFRSPAVVGLAAGIGLMLASVPLSLSRGGLAAVLVAVGVTGFLARRARGVWTLLGGLGVVAVGLAVWFGWGASVARFGTVIEGTADNRTPLWAEVWPIAGRFPLTGVGGGALPRAEQTFRTQTVNVLRVFNSAANEYLEALIEGGFVRLALTVGLAAAALGAAVAGHRRIRRRSAGPFLLGGVFGLTAVVAHSVVDFGIHMPSVALLTAVVTAQVVAAGRDPQRGERERGALRGPAAVAAGVVVVVFGVLVAWSGWRTLQVERLKDAAENITRTDAPDRWDRAVVFLDAATQLRPGDGELWSRLSAAHLAAAHERGPTVFMAVAGPLGAVAPPDTLPDGEMNSHVLPALRAARVARDRGPLLAGPHLRLGTYSRLFARTEPATVHFERAKRVGGWDPDVWYLSGAAALARGDADAAWADWRESLRRDPRRLGVVVRAAEKRIPPEEIRDRILTDDPVLWVAATDELDLDADGRRAWLQAAADRWQARSRAGAVPATEAEWLAWGTTLERLKQHDAALGIWLGAIERLPESVPIRDRLVVRLEGGERYEEAIAHLEWLLAHKPEDGRVRVRHEAARHALKLKREIEGR